MKYILKINIKIVYYLRYLLNSNKLIINKFTNCIFCRLKKSVMIISF